MFVTAWKFIGNLLVTQDESRVFGKFHVDRRVSKAGEQHYIRALIANSEKMHRLLSYSLQCDMSDETRRALNLEIEEVIRDINQARPMALINNPR